jgi:hypothetical protein
MMRFVFAAPLIGHGLAHLSGAIASWASNLEGFSDRPWILSSGVTLQSAIGRAFGLLWLAALVGFVGTGLGLVFRQEWWPALAIPAAVISLAAIIPWWKTVPPGAWVGAAFDLLVIIILLLPLKDRILDIVR